MRRAYACLMLVVGCAHSAGDAAVTVETTGALAAGALTGVWEWTLRGDDGQGTLRVEQEEWHLTHSGARVEGFYDRAVTVVSLDDRLFRCNRKLGFTRFVRVRLAGDVEGDRVRLREVGYDAKPGPCEDGARTLVSYSGQVEARTLLLRFGDAGSQSLRRREGTDTAPELARRVDNAGPSGLAELERGAARRDRAGGAMSVGDESGPRLPTTPRASLPVAGVWVWSLRSIDAEGDERNERERWQLRETPEGITGFYERSVDRARATGVWPCNGEPRQAQTTRYELSGHRLGDEIVLNEVSYTSDKTPCDNGLRRLDTYRGSVTLDGDELVLGWGAGHQVLRRWKPDEGQLPPSMNW